MKKFLLFSLLIIPMALQAQVTKLLHKTIELSMPKTTSDTMPGTRGASVAWHPVQQKYYAAFAGNEGFPFAVFNASGKRLSGDALTCWIDIRGLWYNPTLKMICGNAYFDNGWFRYKLDAKGIPTENEVYLPGQNQPDEQSVGAYNPSKNEVYFLFNADIVIYDENGVEKADSSIHIYPGKSKPREIESGDDENYLSEDYNGTLVYTGIANAEFGLWNIAQKQIELYSRKTGLMTQRLKLPEGVETYPLFDFAYANGTYWLFNQSSRRWTGYK